MNDDLKNLEVYCLNESCGDPVAGADGKVYFTKRKMHYAGYRQLACNAVYKCPVCGTERVFTRRIGGAPYYEI